MLSVWSTLEIRNIIYLYTSLGSVFINSWYLWCTRKCFEFLAVNSSKHFKIWLSSLFSHYNYWSTKRDDSQWCSTITCTPSQQWPHHPVCLELTTCCSIKKNLTAVVPPENNTTNNSLPWCTIESTVLRPCLGLNLEREVIRQKQHNTLRSRHGVVLERKVKLAFNIIHGDRGMTDS